MVMTMTMAQQMKHMPSALALASALCHIATIAVLMRGRTDLATAPGLAGGSHRNLESAEPPQDLPGMDPLLAQTVARLEELVDAHGARLRAVEVGNAEVTAILKKRTEGHEGTRYGGARTAAVGAQLFRNTTGDEPGNGGALHLTGAGVVTITDTKVVRNEAGAEGGGLWNSADGVFTIKDSIVKAMSNSRDLLATDPLNRDKQLNSWLINHKLLAFEAADAMLLKECENLDAIITTALIPGMDPPLLIKKNMVDAMPVGSVTIDLAAESGFAVGRGNVETTVPGEVFVTPGGVTSVGYTNWPSLMASTASRMYVFSTGCCFFSLSSVLLYISSFHLRVVALPFRLLTVHPGFLCNRPHHCPHYCPAVLLLAPA